MHKFHEFIQNKQNYGKICKTKILLKLLNYGVQSLW